MQLRYRTLWVILVGFGLLLYLPSNGRAVSLLFPSLAVPDARESLILEINNSGVVVGSSRDDAFFFHRVLFDGTTYAMFGVPGTAATVLHNNDGGDLVGLSADSHERFSRLLVTPVPELPTLLLLGSGLALLLGVWRWRGVRKRRSRRRAKFRPLPIASQQD
jgi:hypothetical protein